MNFFTSWVQIPLFLSNAMKTTSANALLKHRLIVSFNSRTSYKKFEKVLKKVPFLSFNLTVKSLKSSVQLVSLLKSPHVNKTAQEQFFKKKTLIIFDFSSVSNYPLFCLFLKKLKQNIFADVSIKHVIVYRSKEKKKFFLNCGSRCPEKVLRNRDGYNKCTNRYLSILDGFGEFSVTSKNYV